MTSQPKAAPTPGAVRAAEQIAITDSATLRKHIAEIIDRETGCKELLEALEHAHLHFLQDNNLTTDDREMLDDMWASIRKFKDGL